MIVNVYEEIYFLYLLKLSPKIFAQKYLIGHDLFGDFPGIQRSFSLPRQKSHQIQNYCEYIQIPEYHQSKN